MIQTFEDTCPSLSPRHGMCLLLIAAHPNLQYLYSRLSNESVDGPSCARQLTIAILLPSLQACLLLMLSFSRWRARLQAVEEPEKLLRTLWWLNKDDLPIGSYIWLFGYQLVDYLGRIRGCGLVGGDVSLGVSFEISKAHTIPVLPSLPIAFISGCKTLSYIGSSAMPICFPPWWSWDNSLKL